MLTLFVQIVVRYPKVYQIQLIFQLLLFHVVTDQNIVGLDIAMDVSNVVHPPQQFDHLDPD